MTSSRSTYAFGLVYFINLVQALLGLTHIHMLKIINHQCHNHIKLLGGHATHLYIQQPKKVKINLQELMKNSSCLQQR